MIQIDILKPFYAFLISLFLLSCSPNKKIEIYDTIVIGGGLMGSTTAWHLSNDQGSVLLLEKQGAVYTEGSSLGKARIARSNNRGNDMWSYLHNRSITESEKLIDFLNQDSQSSNYKIEDIYTTSPVTYVGRIGIYEQLMSSLIRQKVDYKIATNPSDAKELFDYNLPHSTLVQIEYNHLSGTINPQKLIEYTHDAIRRKENEIWYQHEVAQISKKNKHYELIVKDLTTGTEKKLKSNKIVSAAGPYTGQLLNNVAPYFEELIHPQRVFLTFLKINTDIYDNLSPELKNKLKDGFPVINSSTGTRSGSFFSMIEYFDKDNIPIIKIGGHFQRSEIEDLDQIWHKDLTPQETEWCTNGMGRYMKLLNLPINTVDFEIVDSYSCVYSLSDSEVPYVTPILEDGVPNYNFIVLGGMSGVGGKGAMTYGLIGSNLITGNTDADLMYQQVVKALGHERLDKDVQSISVVK